MSGEVSSTVCELCPASNPPLASTPKAWATSSDSIGRNKVKTDGSCFESKAPAAFIGAGGLGEPIVSGLALSDTRMILSGAIPAALLAIVVDAALALIERWTRPGGL